MTSDQFERLLKNPMGNTINNFTGDSTTRNVNLNKDDHSTTHYKQSNQSMVTKNVNNSHGSHSNYPVGRNTVEMSTNTDNNNNDDIDDDDETMDVSTLKDNPRQMELDWEDQQTIRPMIAEPILQQEYVEDDISSTPLILSLIHI